MEQDDCQSNEFYMNQRAHFSYHEALYKDYSVMELFQKVLSFNPLLIRGKVVLDVGAGSGIFSLFAARAGARKVYSWEPSILSLYNAEVFKENDFESTIVILNGPAEQIQLPEKVDVIFTSSFGYAFFLESLFSSFLLLRDRFLSTSGITLPGRANFSIAGFEVGQYHDKPEFWDDVYGFDFSPMKGDEANLAVIDVLTSDRVLTLPFCFESIDFINTNFNGSISGSFHTICQKPGKMEGIAFWFDIIFLYNKVDKCLSTSPLSDATHWCHTLLPFVEPIEVQIDDVLEGFIEIKCMNNNYRPINIDLRYKIREIANNIQFIIK